MLIFNLRETFCHPLDLTLSIGGEQFLFVIRQKLCPNTEIYMPSFLTTPNEVSFRVLHCPSFPKTSPTAVSRKYVKYFYPDIFH